eukprot:4329856-Amphidinium_carterae.1
MRGRYFTATLADGCSPATGSARSQSHVIQAPGHPSTSGRIGEDDVGGGTQLHGWALHGIRGQRHLWKPLEPMSQVRPEARLQFRREP